MTQGVYGSGHTCTTNTTPVLPTTNRLGGTHTYDNSGDLTYDGTNALTYDAEGRIASSSQTSGTTTYVYGADGQRVGKAVGGAVTNYARDLDGSLLVTYANGDYKLEPQELWVGGKHFGTVVVNADLTQTSSLSLTNWLGSEAARTDSTTGLPTAAFASQPYGDFLTPLFGADTDDVHFTGKERDAESGNDYFGARYYSSAMGRFMSPDPLPWIGWQHGDEDDEKKFDAYISNPQDLNMYAYVLNNPLNKTDPTGMNACGTSNDSSCKVTVTITDRGKDKNGNYNDQFTGVKGQGNYNATASVTVNGKDAGTFLVKTTPSDSSSAATIANGTYSETLTTHGNDIAIRLQPTMDIPTIGPNPSRQDGASFAQGILIHKAGIGQFYRCWP